MKTANAAKLFTGQPVKKKKTELCRCDAPQDEDDTSESALTYRDPELNFERCRYVKERTFWDFVTSNQWEETLVVTSGRLLNSIVRVVGKMVDERKVRVYKSVSYQSMFSQNPVTLSGGDANMKLGIPVVRITSEYYFPTSSYLIHQNIKDRHYLVDLKKKAIAKFKADANQVLPETQKSANKTSFSINDVTRDYFLPRINATFEEECLTGIQNYQIFRVTSTDSITWKTVRQIIIKKI